nr:MAG TPA: hypothetical protein [Caudoviricetes sp.]
METRRKRVILGGLRRVVVPFVCGKVSFRSFLYTKM